MADVSLPGAVYNQNPTGLPLEAQPVGFGEGVSSQFGASMRSSLGSSLETQEIGKALGGGTVPYDQLKKVFDEQKLDASVFPKGQPVRAGEAIAIANQQLAIQRDQDLSARAGTDKGAVGFVAGLAGGLADPALMGLGLLAGPVLGAARAGLGAAGVTTAKGVLKTGAPLLQRAATGAAEGAGGAGAYDIAKQQVGTAQGDRDISTGQIVRDMGLGGAIGLAGHAAFGTRPRQVDLDPKLNMVAFAEDTAGYAKTHGGMDPNAVVSKKGAVGIYQITPDTAKSLGFNPDMLKDPTYNRQVAEANMAKLFKKYGDDPDAIAIAWNGGQGLADRWIQFGRRNVVLPKETQDYLNRIHKGDSQIAATNMEAAPPGPFGKAGDGAQPSSFVEPKDGERMSPAKPLVVPARQLPDGAVRTGTPGGTHYSTFTPEEIDDLEAKGGFTSASGGPGIEPLFPKDGRMGFQEIKPDGTYGPFMDREEAQAFVGQAARPGGLESVHYNESVTPSKTDMAVAKTAIAQAEQGSEINVEPVIKGMTDEAEGKKADPQDLARAVPKRNSELTPPAILAKLEAVNEQTKSSKPAAALPTTGREPHPDLSEIQRLAKEATEEAANIHAGMTGEAPGAEVNKFETYMKAADEDFKKSEGAEAQPEFQKALEAAVQCGLKNGVE